MGTAKITLMEELMKQTQSFKEFCKKIDNLDHFEALLRSIFIKESQVIDFLSQETNQELKEIFQKWQKETSEFLSFCRIIMEERRKMIGENIFNPQKSDDQSIILLIHVASAYESLKEKLNRNKELESQIFQLHNLQNKINQRFKEIFKNATIDLLTEELPRKKASEETSAAYKKYVEEFYSQSQENTKIEKETKEKEMSLNTPEDIFIIPDNIEPTFNNYNVPVEEVIFEEPKETNNITKSSVEENLEPIPNLLQMNVITEAIKNRKRNYEAYLKKLYEIMDDFELARQEIRDASNGRLKITDFLQNRYNKGVVIQGVVVKEIKRIKELEIYIEDPSVDLKIPNSDMSKEAIIEYFENDWVPGNKYIPINKHREALPLPKVKENAYAPSKMEENQKKLLEIFDVEPENPAKYSFGTELILHQNAKLWGRKGPLEGESPIPAKYPLDAIRYTKGYIVMLPNGQAKNVYDEESLSGALNNQGKVIAVEAFDGFYSINDVTLKEKVATIKH